MASSSPSTTSRCRIAPRQHAASSGKLDLRWGQGSAIEQNESLINWPPGEATNLHRDSNHRSIYLCMLRHSPPPELAAFDLPDGVAVNSQRDVTTLPTQALFLLNSRFVVEQAEALAARTLAESNFDELEKVQAIFRRTLLRNPNQVETKRSLEHVQAVR